MITALSVFHIPSPSPFGSTMTAITQTWLHPPPPPFLFLHLCLKDSDHIEAPNLSSSLTLSGNGPKKQTKQNKKKKPNNNGRDRRTMEDCGYGPGLGQITVSLTTIIPALTPAPPSTPVPLCTSTPTVLNCSALTSTCHLCFPIPSLC